MAPRYGIGQKVTIKPVGRENLSPRDCAIDAYTGQIGEVTDYYWIETHMGEISYIYMIRVGSGYKELALHEDEIEAYIG